VLGGERRGFSLVELIVVMVILGMLAGLVAVRTRGYLVSSKQNAARAEIANIVKAIETFYADQGRYPTTDEGLQTLVEGTDSWPDGFLNKLPRDPWKNAYEYVSPGSNEPYEVVSLGADGREGGEGENRDFTSEELDGDA
jgi:general secretion pathway protein G